MATTKAVETSRALFHRSQCVMHRLRWFTFLAAVVLGLAMVLTACDAEERSSAEYAQTEATSSSEQEGGEASETERRKIPSFEGVTLEGSSISDADWQGKVVVLNFWATWCAPCRIEIPRLIDLHEEMNDQPVRVVGISIDEEGEAVVRPYADEIGITYPLMVDPEQELAEKFGGHYAVPTTFVIDTNGEIRQRYMRVVEHDELVAAVEPLLDDA